MQDSDKNTWIGGMDQDSSKSKFQPNKYYELRNAHIVTHEGLSTGSIENEKGTSLTITLPAIPSSTSLGLSNVVFNAQAQADIKIIGWTFYRDDLIVISTTSDGTTDNVGHVWLIPFNIGTGQPSVTISVAAHLRYAGPLNLNPNFRIRKLICRYEFGTSVLGGVYKIYWTDGKNLLRHLNLYESIHYHTGTIFIDVNTNTLEVLPYIGYQSPITLNKVITGGSYNSGMVQYAYQYYKLYGVETRFSPASKLIHLTSSNEYASDSSDYFGNPIDTYTGKAVQIIIPAITSTIFDRVRVISLFYNSYNSTPLIKVIADLVTSSSITHLTDINGPTIDIPPTLEEYTTLGGNIFTCQDMEVKDNRLIPANITTLPGFDITWDSRAYRFNSATFCDLYTSSKVFEFGPDSTNWSTVPLTNDCFNLFNEIKQGNDAITPVGSIEYMYQSNGVTLGGEGPNIKYEFIIKTVELDEGNETQGDVISIGKIQTILNSNPDQSYTNYCSPYIHSEFVGYMRDEIYSFAIEWFDQYGRQSFASWIGDIRFPRMYDDNVLYQGYTTQENIYDINITQFNPDIEFAIQIFTNGTFKNYISTSLVGTTPGDAIEEVVILIEADGYTVNVAPVSIFITTSCVITISKLEYFQVQVLYNYGVIFTIANTQPYLVSFKDFRTVYKGFPWGTTDFSQERNYANILGIKFTIKTAPIGVTAFRIVRCPVTSFDKTNLFQGLVEPTIYDVTDPFNINYPNYKPIDLNTLYLGPQVGTTANMRYNKSLVNISTSEPIFFKDNFTFEANDFITLPVVYDGTKFFQSTGLDSPEFPSDYNQSAYNKFTSIVPYMISGTTLLRSNTISVVDAKVVTPKNIVDAPVRVGIYNYLNYGGFYSSSLGKGSPIGKRGSNIVVNLSNDFICPNAGAGVSAFYLGNYKRSITPYGGNSYATRTQRYYIPCTDVTSITAGSSNTTINVYGGDTYISYFSYLRNYTDYALIKDFIFHTINDAPPKDNYNLWMGIPVETRLNLDLRHDKLLPWYKRSNPESINLQEGTVSMTAGSNTVTRITSGSPLYPPFVSGDIGKTIKVLGVGTSGVDITGTIIAWTSGTSISVSFNAITTRVSPPTIMFTLPMLTPYWVLQETQKEGLEIFPNYYPEDVKDLYLYNSVYSKENDVNKYYPKPLNFQEVTQYGTRIKASEKRISGNTIDQWLKFPANLFKDVDSPYGDISALKLFKDQLFFFQDSGFGIQPINERSTTVDESGTKIVLGDGEILGKYGYISRLTGCKHQASIVATEDQMHFFDIRLKKWNVYTGQTPLPLSSVSGLHSYFQDEIYSQYTNLTVDKITSIIPLGIHGVYDTQNNRVLMTILSSGFAETLSYNLFTNTYEAFFDFAPTLYLSVCDRVLTVSNETTGRGLIYKLDSGDYGKYFGSSTYKDTVIQFLVNKNPENIKIFNNLEYNSYITLNDLEVFTGNIPDTLTNIQITNDYQDTGVRNLFIFGNTGTPGATDVMVRRRFRTWKLDLPRSIAMKTGDRTDARLHGEYILVTLKFTNNGNKRLILHDVTTHFNVT